MHTLRVFGLSILCGCPVGANDTATPDPDTEAFVPTEGHWSYDSQETTVDTCDTHGEPRAGGFVLTVTGAASFDLTTDEGYGTFTCALDGLVFLCDARRAWEEDFSDEGMDAVLYNLASAEGTFLASDRLEGTHTGQLGCDGADCDEAWAWMGVTPPCEVVVAFTMSADG
jgi:hypothetical protein